MAAKLLAANDQDARGERPAAEDPSGHRHIGDGSPTLLGHLEVPQSPKSAFFHVSGRSLTVPE